MKRLIVVVLLALFACHSAFAGQTSTGKKLAKTPSSKSALVRPVQATEPKAPFEAYAVADAADGKLLEGLNVNHRWPQASLTKLMLALVVMDQLERGELRLDARVTVSKKAEGMGGSQVFLKAGETFALNELMQAALVESANDAAYAVAEIATGAVILVMLFVETPRYLEGSIIFVFLSLMLIALVMLIKDMDNPFEFQQGTSADVDIDTLLNLGSYFDEREANLAKA